MKKEYKIDLAKSKSIVGASCSHIAGVFMTRFAPTDVGGHGAI
jgi:hypothetical protein